MTDRQAAPDAVPHVAQCRSEAAELSQHPIRRGIGGQRIVVLQDARVVAVGDVQIAGAVQRNVARHAEIGGAGLPVGAVAAVAGEVVGLPEHLIGHGIAAA